MNTFSLFAVACISLAACGKAHDATQASAAPEKMFKAETRAEAPAGQVVSRALANRKIVRTGTITFEAEKHDILFTQVRAAVASNEGFLFSSDADLARSGRKRGTYVFKIPVERFDRIVEILSRLSGVLTVKASAEDVTMQWNDLEGRLKSAEDIRRSLLNLLQTRAGDMDSVLKVEREIHRVTDTIETLKGQLRSLEDQTTLSSLTVVIQEPQALDEIEPNLLQRTGNAFITALSILVDVILGCIMALGALIPLSLFVWLILFIIRKARKRKQAG